MLDADLACTVSRAGHRVSAPTVGGSAILRTSYPGLGISPIRTWPQPATSLPPRYLSATVS